MNDQIKLKNLEVFANHGVFPEETKLGQKFLVDVTLYTDTRKAGFSDELSESVDYGAVSHFIANYMKEHTFKLLEAVAEHLAEALLLQLPKVNRVDLELKKPWAPIALPLDTVSVAVSRSWHEVYLGIGSNLGEREAYIEYALKCLLKMPRVKNVQLSSLIETPPYGYLAQPPFLNGVIALQTLYEPYELLDVLHRIENEAGRERKIHWGPRTLDLDILFYDQEILESPQLMVPHPDLANRLFVLQPLAELCPGKLHPVLHKTVLQMKKELEAAADV